jgi:hypothetical protein
MGAAHEGARRQSSLPDSELNESRSSGWILLRSWPKTTSRGHRTRTRTETAGTTCSASSELPASTEGYCVLRSAAAAGGFRPQNRRALVLKVCDLADFCVA